MRSATRRRLGEEDARGIAEAVFADPLVEWGLTALKARAHFAPTTGFLALGAPPALLALARSCATTHLAFLFLLTIL